KACELARQYNRDEWRAQILIGVGGTYANQRLIDTGKHSGFRTGLNYMNEALDIALEKHYTGAAENAYYNMAAIYLNMKQPDSAIFYAEKALRVSSDFNDRSRKIRSLLTLGAAFMNKKE